MITVVPNLAHVTVYKPPWAGKDRRPFLRLDLNESTQPVPGPVAEGLARHIRDVGVESYPDDSTLVPALADYCGVHPDDLLPTNGSDQGIDIVLRALLRPGDRMVIARPEFPIFGHVATLIGADIAGVPYGPAFEFPYDAFSGSISPKTRLVVLINPNNPTGTPVSIDYIEMLLKKHPEVPILVDEAYYEFTKRSVVGLLANHDNLIVLRTFSKAFAMAGLRMGYVVANSGFIGELRKIRGPFDVNCMALRCAALQLENRQASLSYAAQVMDVSKPFVSGFMERHGIRCFGGSGNFLLVRPDDRDALVAYLQSHNILVRPMHGAGLEGLIRMSIGTLDEMGRLTQVYGNYLRRKE